MFGLSATTCISDTCRVFSIKELGGCISQYTSRTRAMGIEKQSKLLRSFHNKVKNFLITAYASNIPVLFDIGVGRGGDMFKWMRANVGACYAYDIDYVSVQDAKKRLLQSSDMGNCDCHLLTLESIAAFKHHLQTHLPDLKANAISCQFAIHYFFSSKETIRELMAFVSDSLVDDGCFIGTFMQGDTILKLTNGLKETFSNPQMMIQPNDTAANQFGTSIDVFLTNTLYFGDKSVSSEYLVMTDTLVEVAQEYGLYMVNITPFEEHYANFNIHLDADVQECSFAYASFVFQKTSLKD